MRPRGWRGEPGPRGEATGGRRGGGDPRGRRGPGQRGAGRGGGRSGADGRDGCVGRIISVHLLWPNIAFLCFSFLQNSYRKKEFRGNPVNSTQLSYL